MQKPNFGTSPSKPQNLTRAAAESLAIEVLTFLAGEPARLDRFLSLSGLEAGHLRSAAADPGFLGSVLDYLASDEPLLLAFAANAGHEPSTVSKAREILSPAVDMP
ncbi:MAG: DUF3572 domain-containing protein [Beijerinckiaceae bacterium]|nr:DUF3572 domain-containing protein [Beijerinckiaceae bacterium]MCI0737353.1 DUF3572 domain-containing protein [Beijerinckiaceae bacterium]